MHELNVALLQMTACGSGQAANQAKGEAFCRRAREMGADVALFPEMWNIGYTFERHDEAGASEKHAEQPSSGDLWRAPELWQPGDGDRDASPQEVIRRWQAQAISRESDFVTHFRRLARELNMAIALTYLERWEGPPRNKGLCHRPPRRDRHDVRQGPHV